MSDRITGDEPAAMSGFTRRAVIAGAAAASICPPFAFAATPVGALVRTRNGLVRGEVVDGIRLFRGIPYAAAPTGARRFLPPQPMPAWSGIREATAFAAAPLQPAPPAGLSERLYLGAETGEDCLYLNIWAPAAPGRYPVFAWIHGGGNVGGAASQLDGAAFARSGIVCITIGYRVGAAGFLELGGLLGPRYRGSGVNGLRDQIAALHWIRRNVAAFGGDPARVTLGGQSAGAKNVATLLASPLAEGLFAAAIVESGGQTVHDLAAADDFARLIGAELAADGRSAQDLLNLPGPMLLQYQQRAVSRYSRPFPFRAVTGTDVVPAAPLASLAAKRRDRRRLLIGTNRDESIAFVDRRAVDAPVTTHELANLDEPTARKIEARYRDAFPNLTPLRRRVRFLTAEEYGVASVALADAHRRAGGDTWFYRFERAATEGPFQGWAGHGAEVGYVWRMQDAPVLRKIFGAPDAAMRRLEAELHGRWCAFIKGGAPDVAGLPRWPRYDGQQVLRIDTAGLPATLDRTELNLWSDGRPEGSP